MNVLTYRPTVTVVDVLDAGACISGVLGFVEKHNGVIVAETAKFSKKSEWIAKATNADGYGNGNGYGDGNGDGNGYGDGDGDGYGYGYGYGDG